jgi:hypothetical protein
MNIIFLRVITTGIDTKTNNQQKTINIDRNVDIETETNISKIDNHVSKYKIKTNKTITQYFLKENVFNSVPVSQFFCFLCL